MQQQLLCSHSLVAHPDEEGTASSGPNELTSVDQGKSRLHVIDICSTKLQFSNYEYFTELLEKLISHLFYGYINPSDWQIFGMFE
jgi:hypothetical protein